MDPSNKEIIDFLEDLKDAALQTEENHRDRPLDDSAPRVTEIVKARANDASRLSLLNRSLVFLLKQPALSIAWYEHFCNSRILMRGIIDVFVEDLGRFPELVTSKDRILVLDVISTIGSFGRDYMGPPFEAYMAHALLIAKVLGRDTGDLDRCWMEVMELNKLTGLDWENMPDDELDTKSRERQMKRKKSWFYTGDIFTDAVVFLANSLDAKDIDGRNNQFLTPVRLLSACRECYGERMGWKSSSIRINSDEWDAARTGEANQRRPVWIKIARDMQKEAWSKLEAQ